MSQNAHTLHLFFDKPLTLRLSQLVFQYLAQDRPADADRWIAELGPDLQRTDLWSDDWFNARVQGHPGHLELVFETGTSAGMPWPLLDTLFQHGLQAAVYDIFYDQVGESERYHFDAGRWVAHGDWLSAHPGRRGVVVPRGDVYAPGAEGAPGPVALADPEGRPMALAALRERDAERQREAQETVEVLLDTLKTFRGSGVSPVDGLVAILMLRAGLRGLFEALAFTVVTVLLFQGLWLWIGLGLVLAVVLPLYRMSAARRSVLGDTADEDTGDQAAAAG